MVNNNLTHSSPVNILSIGILDGNPSDDLLFEDDTTNSESDIKRKTPTINACIADNPISILIDSGSDITCVSEQLWTLIRPQLSNPPILPVTGLHVEGAFGQKSQKITHQTLLPVTIDTKTYDVHVFIIKNLACEMILGCDWMTAQYAIINLRECRLELPGQSVSFASLEPEHAIPCIRAIISAESDENNIITQKETTEMEASATITPQAIEFDSQLVHVQDEGERCQVRTLLDKHASVFSDTPGCVKDYTHVIKMRDPEPFVQRSYPIPHARKEAVDRQIQTMTAMGIIEQGQSPYANPLVTVLKKDGSVRLCLDARKLNSVMIPQTDCPIQIDELLQQFHGAKYFTTLDLTSSYWQIPLREEDRQFTAFLHKGISYQFCRLPFGLQSSSSSFIRCLNHILGPATAEFAVSYVDDILIASNSFSEHMRHIDIILQRLANAGMTVRWSKSKCLRKEVPYLGYILSQGGIQVDNEKIRPITEYPIPQNVKQLRRYLGMCNYYKRFCDMYSHVTSPLLTLLKKNAKWDFNADMVTAFQNVKTALLNAVMLHHPLPDVELQLQTDSSDFGIGGHLFQLDNEGNKRVVAFTSRTLRGPEKRYFATEKEALAVIHAVQKFRTYLIARPFTIWSDNKSLSFIRQCKLQSGRIARWILLLQQYNFSIKFCPGKNNIVADALSRAPLGEGKPDAGQPFTIANFHRCIEEPNKCIQDIVKDLHNTQKKDNILAPIIESLQNIDAQANNPSADEHNRHMLFNGIVFHRSNHETTWKACVPKSVTQTLVINYHHAYGHFGGYKIFNVMREYFYWRKMRRTINSIVRACDICQKAKVCTRTLAGHMSPVIPTGPNSIVATDLYGPIPVSKGNVCYIVVFIDLFSRHVALYALKKATSAAILRKLTTDYIPKIGRPQKIISDNATQFTSRKWYSTLEDEQIAVGHSTVRFPQGNASERVMRELGRIFRTYCHEKHTGWSDYLATIAMWFNVTTHHSTALTPHQLHFGEAPNRVIDKILTRPPAEKGQPTHDYLIHLAKDHITKKSKARVQRHDSHHKCETLNVGDLVLVKTDHQSSASNKTIKKFFLLYKGPFKITKQIGNNAYQLENVITHKIEGSYNIVNLRKYITSQTFY